MPTHTATSPSRRRTGTVTDGPCVGTLVTADPNAGVEVDIPGSPGDLSLPARSTVPLSPDDVGRSVLIVFERGDGRRPIITGLLEDHPVHDPAPANGASVVLLGDPSQTVRVDGRRLHVTARQEVLIECGKSSLRLRSDGRIVILGTDIVSRARRTHKVKGGNVLIN
jgi:hypothetical protein